MKKMLLLILSVSIFMLLLACSHPNETIKGELNHQEVEIQEQETDREDVAAHTTSDGATVETKITSEYCKDIFNFNGEIYALFNNEIVRITSGTASVVAPCINAVGRLREDYLYWAVLTAKNTVQILRIDSEHQIFTVGEIEEEQAVSVSGIDFYEDKIYIQYPIGSVDGYFINQDGKLGAKIENADLLFYNNENSAAEIRMNDPHNTEKILTFPYHLLDAGYSMETYGKEFLTKHKREGELGYQEFVVRESGQDISLFTFYEKAVIHGNYVVYYSSPHQDEISIYDMEQNESKILYLFNDGTFELSVMEDNIMYGIWESFTEAKSYFIGINIITSGRTVYFAVDKTVDYKKAVDEVYYFDIKTNEIQKISLSEVISS